MRLWIIAAVWALFAAPACAQQLHYAYPEQSVWTARPGNPLLKVVDKLMAQAGLGWTSAAYPAGRMFQILQNEPNAFSILVRAPSLQECCLVGARPVTSTELRVWHLDSRPAAASRADLAGKWVILILGYSYADLRGFLEDPANNVHVETAHTHAAGLAMLERGRGDYLLDYTGPVSEELAAHPIPGIASEVLSRLDVHLVLSRRYPNAEKVMARLERAQEGLDVPALMDQSGSNIWR